MARGRLFIAVVTVGLTLVGLSMGLRGADAVKEKGMGRVGAETCATCHEDAVKGFAGGAHGQAMAARSKDLLSGACETCHGPGSAHADDPKTSNIVRHPKDDACLACHSKSAGLMALSLPGHARNGVACLDCHVPGHSPAGAKPLLAAAPSVLCARCHADVALSFKLPYAHRQGSKPFECSACHAVHGENRTGRLQQQGFGGVCLDCHTDKAGPYVYPHPPRAINGCAECHRPHGSTNPKMLSRFRVADLCLECHTQLSQRHNLSSPKYQPCQSCHMAIHGSNRDPNLKDE